MAFVQAKCENCGAILTVDSNLKAAICDHCGTPYVVQDSINYYNSVTQVEHLHADIVNISDEKSAKGRLNAAEAFMKLGKYEEAEKEYKTVTSLTPQEYVGWLGLIEAGTNRYTKRIKLKSEFKTFEDCAHSVEVFAPVGTSEQLLQPLREYLESEKEKNLEIKQEMQSQIQTLKRKLDPIETKERSAREGLAKVDAKRHKAELKRFKPNSKSTVVALYWIGIFTSIIVNRVKASQTPQDVITVWVSGGLALFLFVSFINKYQYTTQYGELGNTQKKLHAIIDQVCQQKADIQDEIDTVQMQLDEIE